MKKSSKSQSLLLWFEPIFWTLLSLTAVLASSSSSWSSVVVSVYTLFSLTKQQNESCPIWRQNYSSASTDPQGRSMMVVVPLLMDTISKCSHNHEQQWLLHAKLTCILPLLFYSKEARHLGVALGIVAITMDPTLRCWRTFWTVASWIALCICIKTFSGLHQVFTVGEWGVVSGLFAMVLTEFLVLKSDTESLHGVVSVAGVVGCGVACMLASCFRTDQSFPTIACRVLVLVLIPFMSVEVALIWNEYEPPFLPRSVSWLVSFLHASEGGDWPRVVWLLYWTVLLVIAFALAPSSAQSVVVARKWFHFVAILLFGPVTLVAPQLMSLSYAIALSLLLVMENLRPWLPTFVQDFYKAFLHDEKDRSDNKVVVTHMALIGGCAMPLWIAEIVGYQGKLLPLWGVVCLGVGDSMGAIVGSFVGKTRWHTCTGRTLEGSLAVWMSMAVSCHLLVGNDEPWIAAATCVTLLEAWTQQIDNLILPLAGTTLILMQQCV